MYNIKSFETVNQGSNVLSTRTRKVQNADTYKTAVRTLSRPASEWLRNSSFVADSYRNGENRHRWRNSQPLVNPDDCPGSNDPLPERGCSKPKWLGAGQGGNQVRRRTQRHIAQPQSQTALVRPLPRGFSGTLQHRGQT